MFWWSHGLNGFLWGFFLGGGSVLNCDVMSLMQSGEISWRYFQLRHLYACIILVYVSWHYLYVVAPAAMIYTIISKNTFLQDYWYFVKDHILFCFQYFFLIQLHKCLQNDGTRRDKDISLSKTVVQVIMLNNTVLLALLK